MADIRQVTADFAVAPQLAPADMAALAARGVRTVIANRPDGEAPGQPSLDEMAEAARAAGLSFVGIPVRAPTPEAAAAMAEALRTAARPVVAYCRTGTRSVTLWAMAEARDGRMPVPGIVAAAREAGYDLQAQAGALQDLRQGG